VRNVTRLVKWNALNVKERVWRNVFTVVVRANRIALLAMDQEKKNVIIVMDVVMMNATTVMGKVKIQMEKDVLRVMEVARVIVFLALEEAMKGAMIVLVMVKNNVMIALE
jgi:hypothetical protein